MWCLLYRVNKKQHFLGGQIFDPPPTFLYLQWLRNAFLGKKMNMGTEWVKKDLWLRVSETLENQLSMDGDY